MLSSNESIESPTSEVECPPPAPGVATAGEEGPVAEQPAVDPTIQLVTQMFLEASIEADGKDSPPPVPEPITTFTAAAAAAAAAGYQHIQPAQVFVPEPIQQQLPMYTVGSQYAVAEFQPEDMKQRSELTLHILNSHIGRIIGRGGQRIKEIERFSGASIQLSKPERADQSFTPSTLRSVCITGTPEQIEACKQLVDDSISQPSEQSGYSHHHQHGQHHNNQHGQHHNHHNHHGHYKQDGKRKNFGWSPNGTSPAGSNSSSSGGGSPHSHHHNYHAPHANQHPHHQHQHQHPHVMHAQKAAAAAAAAVSAGDEPLAFESVAIPATYSGLVVGTRGIMIGKMQSLSGTTMSIAPHETTLDSVVVNFEGTVAGIEYGKTLVADLIARHPDQDQYLQQQQLYQKKSGKKKGSWQEQHVFGVGKQQSTTYAAAEHSRHQHRRTQQQQQQQFQAEQYAKHQYMQQQQQQQQQFQPQYQPQYQMPQHQHQQQQQQPQPQMMQLQQQYVNPDVEVVSMVGMGGADGVPAKTKSSVVIRIPDKGIVRVIGKKGARVKQLQKETGADIYLPSDCVPGTKYREIVVSGKQPQVYQCVAALQMAVPPPHGTPQDPASMHQPAPQLQPQQMYSQSQYDAYYSAQQQQQVQQVQQQSLQQMQAMQPAQAVWGGGAYDAYGMSAAAGYGFAMDPSAAAAAVQMPYGMFGAGTMPTGAGTMATAGYGGFAPMLMDPQQQQQQQQLQAMHGMQPMHSMYAGGQQQPPLPYMETGAAGGDGGVAVAAGTSADAAALAATTLLAADHHDPVDGYPRSTVMMPQESPPILLQYPEGTTVFALTETEATMLRPQLQLIQAESGTTIDVSEPQDGVGGGGGGSDDVDSRGLCELVIQGELMAVKECEMLLHRLLARSLQQSN